MSKQMNKTPIGTDVDDDYDSDFEDPYFRRSLSKGVGPSSSIRKATGKYASKSKGGRRVSSNTTSTDCNSDDDFEDQPRRRPSKTTRPSTSKSHASKRNSKAAKHHLSVRSEKTPIDMEVNFNFDYFDEKGPQSKDVGASTSNSTATCEYVSKSTISVIDLENAVPSTSKDSATGDLSNIDSVPMEKRPPPKSKKTPTTLNDSSDEFSKEYPHDDDVFIALRRNFGFEDFRTKQKEVINASLTGHDCFVIMPAAGGKSLCYQLPALLMPGVTVVVSPLRSTVVHQVDKLRAADIPTGYLWSDDDCDFGQIKLLYVTPGNKAAEQLKPLHESGSMTRIVMDEVHCSCRFGHDFRPDYENLLLDLRRLFPNVPVTCLTATANEKVRNDLIKLLSLKNPKGFVVALNRANIRYNVVPKSSDADVAGEITRLIDSKFRNESGVVYCMHRRECDQVADRLTEAGILARVYHAKKHRSFERRGVLADWMEGRFHVIVSLNAFAMGLDKPDVRFVVHHSMPKSVEALYQESGIAGRDGKVAYSYLFYSYFDAERLINVINRQCNCNYEGTHEDEKLKRMVTFCENVVECRRYMQLTFLGEKGVDRKQLCAGDVETMCDNCKNGANFTSIDVTMEARHLCRMVDELSKKKNVTLVDVARAYDVRRSDMAKVQRILIDLVSKKILKNCCNYTAESPPCHIVRGPDFHSLMESDMTITLFVRRADDDPSTSSDRSTADQPPSSIAEPDFEEGVVNHICKMYQQRPLHNRKNK